MLQEDKFTRLIIHRLFFMIMRQERKIVDFVVHFLSYFMLNCTLFIFNFNSARKSVKIFIKFKIMPQQVLISFF